jgi:hypothetical protein
MPELRKRFRQRAADVRQTACFGKRRRFAGRKQDMHRFSFIPSRTRRALKPFASEKKSKISISSNVERTFARSNRGRGQARPSEPLDA